MAASLAEITFFFHLGFLSALMERHPYASVEQGFKFKQLTCDFFLHLFL